MQGEITGHKANPATTAVEMRNLMEDGKKKFPHVNGFNLAKSHHTSLALQLTIMQVDQESQVLWENPRKMKRT